MMTEEAYPGYTEDVRLEEFEDVKKAINERFGTANTALQIRSEFEIAYNKLFDTMMEEYSHRVFDVIYLFMDTFNIDEKKAVRYLNDDNYQKVRNFATNNCNTFYYENIEKKNEKEKCERKGKVYNEYEDTRDLFE